MGHQRTLKIHLVHDRALIRDALGQLLRAVLPHGEITEAASVDDAVEHVRRRPCDVVLLHICRPEGPGLDAIRALRAACDVPVLVLPMQDDEPYAVRALQAGAAGYIDKRGGADELVEAVARVSAGEKHIGAALAGRLAERLDPRSESPPHESLSERELQVLKLIGAGKTTKEMSSDLAVTEKTIHTYRHRIQKKMRMRSSADLVRYAVRAHLVE
jgi:two-component system invasion response regulator UvrY